MDANKRLILTVILSLGILLAFQFLFPQPPPKEEHAAEVQAPPAEEAPPPTEAAPTERQAEAPKTPERKVELQTETFRLVLSSHGAGIEMAELLGPKGRRQGGKDAPQVNLATGLLPTDPSLFELWTGGGLPEMGARHGCELVEQGADAASFRCRADGLDVRKEFRLTGSRTLALTAVLENRSDRPLEGVVDLVVPARVDPAEQRSGGGCGGIGAAAGSSATQMICRYDDEVVHRMFEAKEPVFNPVGASSFAGIEERYFLAVAVPEMSDRASTCSLVGKSPDFLETHLRTQVAKIAPGGSAKLAWELVIGQKELGFLQDESGRIAAQAQIANPRLDETVDLGFWAAIARILLWLMRLFHSILPNWGIAIILLTIAIKVLTFPLTWKSMKSMEAVRKLAPEIEKLKKKHGDDKEKLNVEMMQLYQRHKVNPLGGCLPMLIQMPVWFALYTTLQTSVELYNEPFISGWISDLTSKDPIYLLPISMGVTMFITQKMQPMQMDPAQQKMMLYFMPIFFTFIMLQLPAGLTLYIFTNNLLSIGQQLALRRAMGTAPAVPASEATVEVPKHPKKKK